MSYVQKSRSERDYTSIFAIVCSSGHTINDAPSLSSLLHLLKRYNHALNRKRYGYVLKSHCKNHIHSTVVHIYKRAHINADKHTHAYVLSRTHINTREYTSTHTHTPTHTHTHTHTHTSTWRSESSVRRCLETFLSKQKLMYNCKQSRKWLEATTFGSKRPEGVAANGGTAERRRVEIKSSLS